MLDYLITNETPSSKWQLQVCGGGLSVGGKKLKFDLLCVSTSNQSMVSMKHMSKLSSNRTLPAIISATMSKHLLT